VCLLAGLFSANLANVQPPIQSAEPSPPEAAKSIHLAAGQIVCRPDDIDGNLKQIRDLAQQAAAAGAKLCLFAEGAITGYVTTPPVLAAAPTADGPVAMRLKQMAAELNITIATGTLERIDGGYHVSCFIAMPDGRFVVQRKHLLNDAEKKLGLVCGPAERTLFEVDGVRMAVCICADVGIPGIRDTLAAQGCQVLLLITAGGGGREHIYHPNDLQDPQRLANYVKLMDNVCSVTSAVGDCLGRRMAQMAVNLSGDDGVDHYHPGHSSIIDSRGRIVALLPGEYVIDYLAPQMIHGPVVVQPPRSQPAEPLPVEAGQAPSPGKVLRVVRTQDFEITGRGDASAWKKANWEPLQLRSLSGHPYQTRVKMLYSDTGLYVLMDATDRAITATMKEDFLDLWNEDVFEFFLWPDERHPVYFEYEISPLGYELPILIPNLEGKFLGWRPWHYEGSRKTRTATTVIGGPKQSGAQVAGWIAEVFVPYELLTPLGNVPPKPGTQWRANFYRVDYDDGKSVSWDWSRVGRSFHEFRKFGTLVFD
jgi:predicted amidohydrolase